MGVSVWELMCGSQFVGGSVWELACGVSVGELVWGSSV